MAQYGSKRALDGSKMASYLAQHTPIRLKIAPGRPLRSSKTSPRRFQVPLERAKAPPKKPKSFKLLKGIDDEHDGDDDGYDDEHDDDSDDDNDDDYDGDGDEFSGEDADIYEGGDEDGGDGEGGRAEARARY